MNKYQAFFALGLVEHIRHGARFVLRLAAFLLFFVVFAELWAFLDRTGTFDLVHSLGSMQWYAFYTQMALFASSRLFTQVEDDVRSGNIAYFLIRPVPYLWMRYLEGLGGMFGNFIIYVTAGAGFAWWYIGHLPAQSLAPLYIPLSLFTGVAIHQFFQLAIGMMAMWLQDSDALYRVYQKLIIVLGGLYLPLIYYPDWIQSFVFLTPFPAIMYLPGQMVFADPPLPLAQVAGIQAIWLVISILVMHGLYRICIRRVEVNGG